MKKFFIFSLMLFISNSFAQSKDANKILDDVKKKFDAIRDYEVDVNIKLDFEFVKMPDTKAKIYFKQPDKVKIDSKGFAMLPKQSINFSPAQLLKGDYTALYARSESLDGINTDVIKIIPNNDSADVILTTLWVDQTQKVIRKIETTGKRSGTAKVDLAYDDKNLGLPSQIKFTLNADLAETKKEAPQQQQNEQKENRKWRDRSNFAGNVTVTYSNYRINKGIPDSFFEEKK